MMICVIKLLILLVHYRNYYSLIHEGTYYRLEEKNSGMETVSWMVVLAAAPFALLGFVSYHGMTAEQFIWVWIRSELIEPKQLTVQVNNLYYELLKDSIEEHKKEVYKQHA